jgi:hypothetical protein
VDQRFVRPFTETKNCVEYVDSEKLFFSPMYFCAHVAQNSGENFIFRIFKANLFLGVPPVPLKSQILGIAQYEEIKIQLSIVLPFTNCVICNFKFFLAAIFFSSRFDPILTFMLIYGYQKDST